MTPARFRDCLAALHWTQRGLAAVLQCDDREVRRWAAGQADVPADVADWLDGMAELHNAHPPPAVRRRSG